MVFALLPVIFCVLLIVYCIVFLSFIVKFLSLKIGSIFFCALSIGDFVVADKSNVICRLLVNYIVSYGVFVLFYEVIVVMKMFNVC